MCSQIMCSINSPTEPVPQFLSNVPFLQIRSMHFSNQLSQKTPKDPPLLIPTQFQTPTHPSDRPFLFKHAHTTPLPEADRPWKQTHTTKTQNREISRLCESVPRTPSQPRPKMASERRKRLCGGERGGGYWRVWDVDEGEAWRRNRRRARG